MSEENNDNPAAAAQAAAEQAAKAAQAAAIPAALTEAQVSEWLDKQGYTAYKGNDPRWEKFHAPEASKPAVKADESEDFNPFDRGALDKLVEARTKGLTPDIAAQVSETVLKTLQPLLNTFASSQLNQGVREEAKPYVEEIMKDFGVTPFALSQDPKTAQLVNEAAELRAIKGGKIGPSILFPSESPGAGGQGSSVADDTAAMIAQSESFIGRKLSDDERKEYIADHEREKRAMGGAL